MPFKLARRLALLLSVALVACAGAAGSARAAITVGINTPDAPYPAEFEAFSQLVGAKPKLVMWYQSWAEPIFYEKQMAWADSTGATPVVTWAPQNGAHSMRLRDIYRYKRYDRYLLRSATLAREYGKPFFVRFGHEMNLPGSAFGPGRGGNRPRDFGKAWRYVVRLFRRHGATNVRWVWTPNVDCAGKCPFGKFYPGDSFVDWVGLDGYNYGAVDRTPWLSLVDVFQHSYRAMRRLTRKPLMIAETASTEHGGDKAAWIRQGFAELPQAMPQVRAVLWFNRQKETDWRVNSSATSLAAFRSVVSSPMYDAQSPLLGARAFRSYGVRRARHSRRAQPARRG